MNKKRTGLWLTLAAVMLLSACGIGEAGEPTPDEEAIRTQAVQTAVAQMTVQAALNPTSTEVPPTITPLPTATLGTAVPVGSGASTSGGTGSGSGAAYVSPTPKQWGCEWITQSPYDQALHTGWWDDYVVTLKNTGTKTWWGDVVYWKERENCSYCNFISSPKQRFINANVQPGQTVQIRIDVNVPTQPYKEGFRMVWDLINDNGERFCPFDFSIPFTYPVATAWTVTPLSP
ncbi:MAG: hypothetical protein FJZ98_00175 [Chloroflexi bacterium]|nr:hypothetical protein [Chloroflexota bacterium]